MRMAKRFFFRSSSVFQHTIEYYICDQKLRVLHKENNVLHAHFSREKHPKGKHTRTAEVTDFGGGAHFIGSTLLSNPLNLFMFMSFFVLLFLLGCHVSSERRKKMNEYKDD